MRKLLFLALFLIIITLTASVHCHSKVAFEPMPKTHVCDHEHVVATNKRTLFKSGKIPSLRYKVNHEETVARIAQEQKSVAAKISSSKKRSLKEQAAIEADSFQPIRITFITSTMNANDGRTCLSTGQTIKIGYPASSADVCSTTQTSDCWETCTDAMVVSSEKLKYMNNYLIPQLESMFENAFLTRRLVSDLGIKQQPCGDDITLSSDRVNKGIVASEEDLIVLVTMRPKRQVLGYASHCGVELNYNRPVVGMLNINPMYIDPADALSGILDTAKHELTHLLAFSPDLYDYWYDSSTGSPRTTTTDYVTKSFRDSSSTLQQKSIRRLVTPQIVQQARNHFNCSSITGVELEEYGGDGSRGSHFEARLFMNELMTASDGFKSYADSAVFSQFTFALLEDSGWYKGNWTFAKSLLWGKNAGCSMANDRCEDWQLDDNTGYFCSDSSHDYCNFEHTAVSYCGISSYSSALGYYEHLSNNKQGGYVDFMDFCPYPAKYSNRDCRVSNTGTSLEAFGSQSACFNSNTQSSKSQDARCFKFGCADGTLQVYLGSKQVSCPADQSYLRINSPAGYSGYVDCPQNGYDILCGSDAVSRDPNAAEDAPAGTENIFCRLLGIFCSNSNSASNLSFSTKVSALIIGGAVVLAQV